MPNIPGAQMPFNTFPGQQTNPNLVASASSNQQNKLREEVSSLGLNPSISKLPAK